MIVIGIPILFIIILIFSAYFYIRVKRSNPNTQSVENLLEKEIEANGSRKKEIEAKFFILPDLSSLPFRDDISADNARHLYLRQQNVRDHSDKKMLRFEREYSNLELKSRYGLANLELVASYEENYRGYILSLNLWAEELLAARLSYDAIAVLKHAVSLNSDISKTYTLLAAAYNAEGLGAELDDLLKTINESNLSVKNIIVKHINSEVLS